MIKNIVLGVLAILLSSCGNVKNSSSSDSGVSAGGTSEFTAARQVISDRCLSCHSNWSGFSESDYVSNGLVVKKSPTSSSLYTRIRGNDVGVAGDMPQGQANLTQPELSSIKTWISNMQ